MKLSDNGLTESDKDKLEDYFWCGSFNNWNRFDAFLAIYNQLSSAQYWYALQIAYTTSDNLSYRTRDIKKAFLSKKSYRETLMNDIEFKNLKELPDWVNIYRGMTILERNSVSYGVSWSLSLEVAQFFRDKYIRNLATNHLEKTVVGLRVPKKRIIALFDGRKEQEVIYCHDRRIKTFEIELNQ